MTNADEITELSRLLAEVDRLQLRVPMVRAYLIGRLQFLRSTS